MVDIRHRQLMLDASYDITALIRLGDSSTDRGEITDERMAAVKVYVINFLPFDRDALMRESSRGVNKAGPDVIGLLSESF